ncbi:riboflavin synthase [Lacrimispora amygdalina]|uniref:riboflavin synthase n=1 Tax=Lacrimispora amygdalina TaxID=253257 RepID=UPI000BE3F976|nr:riboflavin synthase [Lacrimispora amygdalina]
MFTGIIEETGVLKKVHKGAHSALLTLQGDVIFDDLEIGDSVSVNGVCLTVSGLSSHTFQADVMHETLNRSCLGRLHSGDFVNLERAMAADGRFGGHIVSGHIDGIGTITSVRRDDNAIWYTIAAEERILRYIVEKGSIALDGISLTVASVNNTEFRISAIPHTVKSTTLSYKKAGDPVNLENDLIGKYMEKLLLPVPDKPQSGGITREFLAKSGY